jgi:hypothetical protein
LTSSVCGLPFTCGAIGGTCQPAHNCTSCCTGP